MPRRRSIRAAISWAARWPGAGLAGLCLLAFVFTRWGAVRCDWCDWHPFGDWGAIGLELNKGAVRAWYWSAEAHFAWALYTSPPTTSADEIIGKVETCKVGIWGAATLFWYPRGLAEWPALGLKPYRPFSEFCFFPTVALRNTSPQGYRQAIIPLWMPFTVFGSASAAAWRRRSRRRSRGECAVCGYDLAGLPNAGVCPECGRAMRRNEAQSVNEPTTS